MIGPRDLSSQVEQSLRVSTEDDPVGGLTDVPQRVGSALLFAGNNSAPHFVVLRGQTQGKVTFKDIELLVKQ